MTSTPGAGGDAGQACHQVEGCLTCGDIAVTMTVVEPGTPDAVCEDEHGRLGSVGIELVGVVGRGDRLLVHGGVAISRLEKQA